MIETRTYLYHLWNKVVGGDKRSAELKKNVFYSLIIKIGSILCSLILVPMTIDFVNPIQYGIWLTVSSIVAWMSFFDIGFSNGLRNKMAEALAHNQFDLAKVYVSTTYFILTAIFMALGIAMELIVACVDIAPLLKIDASYETDLKYALYILIAYFCLNFVIRILGIIYTADQKPAKSANLEFLGQLSTLIAILLSREMVEGSLMVLALSLCVPQLFVWFIATFIAFGKRYKYCTPSIHSVKLEHAKDLLGLGIKFFIIQIAAIIQFQTANILIARLFNMTDVTEYNIAYKYFNVLNMGFMIMLQPFWSAVTNAYSQKDIDWIKKSVKKYLLLSLLTFLGGLIMLGVSQWVYAWWIGPSVSVSFELSAWMLLYFQTIVIGAIFVHFVNGIGALRIQFVSSLISPIVFCGCILFLCKVLHCGVWAILAASIIANFNGLILAPLQYYNIIIKHKQGIWTK